jgi:hypothetical protein
MNNLQEKWHNFINPTKIEHYGYHFSESELKQFPEGRKFLCETKKSPKLTQKSKIPVDKTRKQK